MNLKKISQLGLKQLATICDHTFLMPPQSYKTQGLSAIKLRRQAYYRFMQNSIKVNPYAICVRSEDVYASKKYLQQYHRSDIRISCTIGFPDGSWHSTKYKQYQTEAALADGAHQIDMVINYMDQAKDQIRNDIQAVYQIVKAHKGILKVILQTSQINQIALEQFINICKDIGVQFIKTSTGFAQSGADTKKLKIMKQNFNRGIKISGGVKLQNVSELLSAASGRDDGLIDLNPLNIRIGESGLLN